ncbi:MAG: hypothetical protein RSD22_03725 [Romboutsia sp.]
MKGNFDKLYIFGNMILFMPFGIYITINIVSKDRIKVKNFVTACSTGVMIAVTILLIGIFIAN